MLTVLPTPCKREYLLLRQMDTISHPFFKNVEPEQISALLDSAVHEKFSPDSVIFEERSASDGIYLILKGEIAFRKKLPSGEYRTVSYSKEGEFFGEIGLVTESTRALRAEARGVVEVAKIPKEALIEYINNTPGPIGSILQSVVDHLHDTTRHYVEDMIHQEKMAMVGNMMNSIIHDFKNPFTLISLGAQMIEKLHDDKKTHKVCNTIEDQITRMVGMAEELSEFSRGQQNLNTTPLNLKTLLNRFKELNNPYFQHENIVLSISVSSINFEGEESKLLRVLQNLVGNAIDAFQDSEGQISITAKQSDDENLIIKIADNAGGIPPEIRPHLFDPFVTHGKTKGTGLGTAIAKSIIEAHGGTIHFKTATGEGTHFFIQLPLKQSKYPA